MINVQTDVRLDDFNTLALKSQSSHYFALHEVAEVEQCVRYAQQQQLNIFVLSGGSNLLLPDHIQALTLHMMNKGVEIIEETADEVVLRVQAGEIWHDFVMNCCANGWHGLENLALIPGCVGAAPIQNIGAYGVEVGQFIAQIWAYDIHNEQHLTFQASECQFSYRDSIFKQNAGRYIIYALSFKLYKQAKLKLDYADVAQRVGDQPSAQKLLESIIAIRRAKLPQPAQYPNVGSFFKNPVLSMAQFQQLHADFPQIPHYPQPQAMVKVAAGWLIEQVGWKGKKMGDVGMFERQALVLVNYGQATLTHVQNTYQCIQADVFKKFSIVLEPEPVLLNSKGKIISHSK